MKRIIAIIAIVSALLFSCVRQPEEAVVETQLLPFAVSDTLKQIDSLMQHDADSALMILTSFQISSKFNANYHSLLLSEALYKTDNQQLNRFRNETFQETSLQDAMRFFDSLAVQYPHNDDIVLLSARSHYMNGVGFYENDSVIEACREYLQTLEIMENHFDVNKLTGYKAKFMGLTYNRLGELFSSQFMVEPAIYCGKKSLFFCKIASTSLYGISNNLAKLGQLYEISEQYDTAYYYYNEALNSLPDTTNLIYRDIISSLAVLSYDLGFGFSTALEQLMQVSRQVGSNNELLTRYYTIGSLYYEEHIYDSAIVYLNQVFDYDGSPMRRYQAASYLLNICQMTDDSINKSIYSDYLAQNAASVYDKSYDISRLNELFRNYLNKKSYEKLKRNKVRIGFAIALFVFLAVFSFALLFKHSKRKINKLNKEHLRIIDTEKKARYREKSKMLNTIKQQETKVDTLEQELRHKRLKADISMEAFVNEPVCKKIIKYVSSINVTSRVNYVDYPQLKLDNATIAELEEAISKHFPNFKQRLLSLYPQLNPKETLLCHLYLLGLKDQQISVLTQYHYTTIFRKTKNLERAFGISVSLRDFLQKTAVL